MAAHRPRRTFAPSLVITLGAAAACGGSSKPPPTTVMTNPPAQPDTPPATDTPPTTAAQSPKARWHLDEIDGGHCGVRACTDDDAVCMVYTHNSTPVPCLVDREEMYIFRAAGSTVCEYDDPPSAPPCQPASYCNPPPPQPHMVPIECPDAR